MAAADIITNATYRGWLQAEVDRVFGGLIVVPFTGDTACGYGGCRARSEWTVSTDTMRGRPCAHHLAAMAAIMRRQR